MLERADNQTNGSWHRIVTILRLRVMLNGIAIAHEELDTVWEEVFSENEKVLWSGRPDHGRQFWEFEGQELVYYWSLLAGAVVIWPVGIFADHHSVANAILSFVFLSFVTLVGGAFFYYMASSRAYVMSNLFYAVTDQRAIILRRGLDYRFSQRRYVLSFPYVERYAFPVHQGRKFASIQVGSLLGDDTVQPFGLGLTHPGWPVGRAVGVIPALFESIEGAEAMQIWLQQLTDASQA